MEPWAFGLLVMVEDEDEDEEVLDVVLLGDPNAH